MTLTTSAGSTFFEADRRLAKKIPAC